jgi:uncharacterized Rmd1/YagE family protein
MTCNISFFTQNLNSPSVILRLSLICGMGNTVKISAIRIANQLDLKSLKAALDLKPLADTSSELFYYLGNNKYQCYFNYGVVVFCEHTEDEIKKSITSCHLFQKNPDSNRLRDDHEIAVVAGSEMKFNFDQLVVDHIDETIIRIGMLNLAQSVALDHYHQVSENLLTEIKVFTNNLQNTGKLRIGRTNMMKFIGRALNTQNDIADNIYIFDTPDLVWDDEYLDKLQQGLMKYFELRVRFSEIEYTLRIIDDNLSVFSEIVHQRESRVLEWIVITLILVEVFDLIIEKIF